MGFYADAVSPVGAGGCRVREERMGFYGVGKKEGAWRMELCGVREDKDAWNLAVLGKGKPHGAVRCRGEKGRIDLVCLCRSECLKKEIKLLRY